jgi:hypothetical protein
MQILETKLFPLDGAALMLWQATSKVIGTEGLESSFNSLSPLGLAVRESDVPPDLPPILLFP